jgi:hypothetical protein
MILGQGVLANELFVNSLIPREDIKTHMSQSFSL